MPTNDPSYEDLMFAYVREKKARKESEHILQKQTRLMYHVNVELNAANNELLKQQRIIIQQEKMAALGTLSAGLAHEINNPLSYVTGNLQTLNSYLSIFRELTEQLKNNENLLAISNEIVQTYLPKKDIDYLINDTIDILTESETGLQRVKEIIANLKNFSRTDNGERQLHNINTSIESALSILKSKIHSSESVMTSFDCDHAIYCNPNNLTQVFINIIDNALQAIPTDKIAQIKIRTYESSNEVIITIEDNGCGMSDETLKQIFVPFFTTKPFGKGTGLGLAISHDIIKSMNGHIDVESNEHMGTRFTIHIPIEQRAQERTTYDTVKNTIKKSIPSQP